MCHYRPGNQKSCSVEVFTISLQPFGEMLEWLKRFAWKADIGQKPIAGSNPALSAKSHSPACGIFLTLTMTQPTLFIIAGCNGAGKTTASYSVLPKLLECREFVNADEIAKGLSPFNPEAVAIEAGRLMLQRINLHLSQRKTFAIETTLATRSYASLVKRAHKLGYNVILLFFWLPSPEMAVARVAKRVSEGGHNIPTETIHRRYWLGLKNLFNIFVHIVDSWSIYKNVNMPVELANETEILNLEIYNKIREACLRMKE